MEAEVPELQAAAVTQTAARTATSAHRLRVDPGSDLFFDLGMCVSLCNRRGYRARVTYVHIESCPRSRAVGQRQVSADRTLRAPDDHQPPGGLFDLDGLLVDSEPLWHEAEIRVLGGLGVPLTVEMCRETKGRYVSEAVRHWHDRYPWDSPGIDVVVGRILDILDELIATRLEQKPGVDHA